MLLCPLLFKTQTLSHTGVSQAAQCRGPSQDLMDKYILPYEPTREYLRTGKYLHEPLTQLRFSPLHTETRDTMSLLKHPNVPLQPSAGTVLKKAVNKLKPLNIKNDHYSHNQLQSQTKRGNAVRHPF